MNNMFGLEMNQLAKIKVVGSLEKQVGNIFVKIYEFMFR